MCYANINEVVRAARAWSPQYLPVCSPLILCALLGPASVHVQDDQIQGPHRSNYLSAETIRLILRHFENYWRIGKVLMGM